MQFLLVILCKAIYYILFHDAASHNFKAIQIASVNMPLVKSVHSYFSTKTYVVGTQKNRLNEMVLLSTQNI